MKGEQISYRKQEKIYTATAIRFKIGDDREINRSFAYTNLSSFVRKNATGDRFDYM